MKKLITEENVLDILKNLEYALFIIDELGKESNKKNIPTNLEYTTQTKKSQS